MRGASAAEVKPERGPGDTAVSTFKAPLLTRIFDSLDPEQRRVVLDLGGPCQALLERLTPERGCRIEIADFIGHDGLAALNGALAEDHERVLAELLPQANAERLNLIFCWDLPNYIGLAVLRSLCELLGRRAAAGCRLHMLISYSRRDMPARPGHYVPVAEGQLRQISPNPERIPAPRYSPEDIGKALKGFRYERGVLLANGMQEFVYAWPGGQA